MNPIIDENGTKWYFNEKRQLHRVDGPAIEYLSGTIKWYLNGLRHREDGPAIEHPDGTKYWYLNGEQHREDGPATEYPEGYKSWYYHGEFIDCNSQEEFERIIKLRMFL